MTTMWQSLRELIKFIDGNGAARCALGGLGIEQQDYCRLLLTWSVMIMLMNACGLLYEWGGSV